MSRMFKNRVPRKDIWALEIVRNCIMSNLPIFRYSPNISRVIMWKSRMCHEWEKTEEHINFWWGNLKERESLEDLVVDGMVTRKRIQDMIRKLGVDSYGSGLGSVQDWLKKRVWTFGFHKMLGISWLSENRLGSQEGLYLPHAVSTYCIFFLLCDGWCQVIIITHPLSLVTNLCLSLTLFVEGNEPLPSTRNTIVLASWGRKNASNERYFPKTIVYCLKFGDCRIYRTEFTAAQTN